MDEEESSVSTLHQHSSTLEALCVMEGGVVAAEASVVSTSDADFDTRAEKGPCRTAVSSQLTQC